MRKRILVKECGAGFLEHRRGNPVICCAEVGAECLISGAEEWGEILGNVATRMMKAG